MATDFERKIGYIGVGSVGSGEVGGCYGRLGTGGEGSAGARIVLDDPGVASTRWRLLLRDSDVDGALRVNVHAETPTSGVTVETLLLDLPNAHLGYLSSDSPPEIVELDISAVDRTEDYYVEVQIDADGTAHASIWQASATQPGAWMLEGDVDGTIVGPQSTLDTLTIFYSGEDLVLYVQEVRVWVDGVQVGNPFDSFDREGSESEWGASSHGEVWDSDTLTGGSGTFADLICDYDPGGGGGGEGGGDAAPGVWIDFGRDGSFDDVATPSDELLMLFPEADAISDNVTPWVHHASWSYGGSSDHASSVNPGTATIIVKNADGRWNPDNTGSPLYGFRLVGCRVWIGINEDGSIVADDDLQVHGVFAGYIKEVVPLVEGGATGRAEILCEDPLGAYARRPTKVAAAVDYTYKALREAILADIGESNVLLAAETDTMPLAAADSENALSVLDEINRATGSRHWSNPENVKDDWQTYTVVDRHYKLDAPTDVSINGDDVQAVSGYRETEETIVNYLKVDVSQARFPAGIDTVWTYAEPSFPLTESRVIWATFEDFVKDAALDYTSTGGAVTAVFTNFGTSAKIELWSASSSTVVNMEIEGRMVLRDSEEAVTAQDAASIALYEKRSGGTISSTYSGTPALAQGLADFVVWKFRQPLHRPGITQIMEFPQAVERDLYDVIGLTIDRLHVADRRFEIIGISGTIDPGAEDVAHPGEGKPVTAISWELQETANQTALALFRFDLSAFDGLDGLGA